MAEFKKYKKRFIKVPSSLFDSEEIIMMNDEIIVAYLKLILSCDYKYRNDMAIKVYDINNCDWYTYLSRGYDIEISSIEYLEKEKLIKFKSGYLIVFNIWKRFNIRNSKEYVNWRMSVFERDEFTCKICGQVGGSLQAHHIIRWVDSVKLRFEIDNGITLCKKCHKEIHRKVMD